MTGTDQWAAGHETARPPVLAFAVSTVLGFAVAVLLVVRWTPARDWEYFSALSFYVRSVWLTFRELPTHDPWICGGLNVLGNPQNRLFSPFVLFDLALPAAWANLASLIVYGFAGHWGMFRLLEHFGVSKRWALVGGILWVNSNWFGLHFAEGHIAYGSMQVLPWIFLATLRAPDAGWLLAMGLLLALFLVDGGIYTFIFALFLIVTVTLAFRLGEVRTWLWYPWRWAGAVAVTVLVSLPKTLPVWREAGDRAPDLDHHSFTAVEVARFLLFPFNEIRPNHEYACYLGLALPAFLAARLWTNRGREAHGRWRPSGWWSLLLPALFWFFVGSGWAPAVNPWNALFQRLPLFNNAHMQSRTLLLFFLFVLIALVRSVDLVDRRRAVSALVVAIALVETLVVKSFPFAKQFDLPKEPSEGYAVASTDVIRTTLEKRPQKTQTPAFYRAGGAGLKQCYEPSVDPARLPIRSEDDPSYRGEAYLLAPAEGSAVLVRSTPGHLRVSYDVVSNSEAPHVQLNARTLEGWRLAAGEGRIVSRRDDLLTIALPASANAGTVDLTFRPPYLGWILGAYAAGLALAGTWAVLLWRGRARRAGGSAS